MIWVTITQHFIIDHEVSTFQSKQEYNMCTSFFIPFVL